MAGSFTPAQCELLPAGELRNECLSTFCGTLPPIARYECLLDLAFGADGNETQCLMGFPGFPLSDNATCPQGMFCPNINTTNDRTFPQLCQATPECFQKRLFGEWCPSQGRYEPEVCRSGFYCPNASTILPCPEGHWCVRGSAAPTPCQPLSICPPGTVIGRFYGGALACALLDALLLAYFMLRIFRWEPAKFRANLTERPRRLLLRAAEEAGGGAAAKGVADWQPALPPPATPPPSPRAPLTLSGAWALARRASFSLPAAPPAAAAAAPGAPAPLDAAVLASAKALLSRTFRRCNGELSIRIDFEGLSLTLPPPASKTILSGVTGTIFPARVTAIMGPSGAGKTTFLSVLLGTARRTAGSVRINGAEGDVSSLGRLTGFVPQDDVMLRELTVRENIAHSARIRLPRAGWSAADIDGHCDAVIEVLGLRHCADTPTDRISGGQRKRVNIGMELALAPAAIFLDEPTSGLDSTAALQVCSTLKDIAELGVTVVAVIHQPRLDIFKSFDDLLLLAPGGKTVFAGPQAHVIDYFQGLGLEFSEGGNPADDVLDFVAGAQALRVAPGDAAAARETAAKGSGAGSSGGSADGSQAVFNPLAAAAAAAPQGSLSASASGGSLAEPGSPRSLEEAGAPAASGAAAALVTLRGKEVANYLAWAWAGRAAGVAATAGAAAAGSKALPAADSMALPAAATPLSASELARTLSLRGASFLRQLVLCHNRSLLQQLRQPSWLALELGVSVFAGGMMGIAATAVDELFSGILQPPFTPLSPAPNVQLLPSLGFFIAMAVGIAGSPAAVRAFGEEREVYLREVSAHHSAVAYYLAKNVATLYRASLAALHFAGFFYLVALPTASFASVLGLVWGLFFGVYSLSFIVSMVVERANGALLGTIASLIVACLCGYGPSLTQGRKWAVDVGGGNLLGLITLQDLSYSRWATEIWIHAETLPYRGLFLVDQIPAGVSGVLPARPSTA